MKSPAFYAVLNGMRLEVDLEFDDVIKSICMNCTGVMERLEM